MTYNNTNWASNVRQNYITHLLVTRRLLSRADLMREFSISTAQASKDIAQFIAANPAALHYDKQHKMYVSDLPDIDHLKDVGMDGKKWTDAFFAVCPHVNIDRELMLVWFCNAIMAGYDEAEKRNRLKVAS